MAERERALAPPNGGVFHARAQVMSADDVRRAVTRIAHEVVERNHGLADLAVVGMQTGGVPLARRLAAELERIDGTAVPVATLDATFYRDDIGLRPLVP